MYHSIGIGEMLLNMSQNVSESVRSFKALPFEKYLQ